MNSCFSDLTSRPTCRYPVSTVISTGCTIEEDVEIYDSVIMPGAIIKKGSVIKLSMIGERAVIDRNSKVGDSPKPNEPREIAVVGKHIIVEENSVILPGTIVRGESEN